MERPRRPWLAIIGAIIVTSACSSLRAEDVQLRNRAVGLLSGAALVSRLQGGPYNMLTEVTFSATAADGSLQSGSYTRTRGTDGVIREDLRFADYSASAISVGVQRGFTKEWKDPPYAASKILDLIPYSPGMFDESDVIQQIRDSAYGGRTAVCVEFETVLGEKHLPGEACVDKANGTLLELRTGDQLWEYSNFFPVKGGLFPSRIVYREGRFNLTADLKMSALEERPDDAFAIPPDWTQGIACKQLQMPVAKRAPQPPGEGAPDAPVTDVEVHLHVTVEGTVSSAQVLRPVRADLDAEAVKTVQTWGFQPGTCDGHAHEFAVDATVHFQGWRVKDPQP